jgi:hypothetical protein
VTPTVLVSRHARERALERAGIGGTLVAHEVADAIASGRVSVHAPAWAEHDRRRADRTKAGDQRGRLRWVWPADPVRAYLIARRRGRDVVITCVVPDTPAELAA